MTTGCNKDTRLVKTLEHFLALFGSGVSPPFDAFREFRIIFIQIFPFINVRVSGLPRISNMYLGPEEQLPFW